MAELRHPGARSLAIAVVLWTAVGAVSADTLDGAEDFAPIARNGFALTVDGSDLGGGADAGAPELAPNLGDPSNSYAWSAAWFDDALWVGTNRDVLCFDSEVAPLLPVLGPLIGDCPEPGDARSGVPGPGQRAEIWRYAPSSRDAAGDWGLDGTWERVFQSPSVEPLLAILGRIPRDTPRDIGYRSMSVCDAGDGVPRLYVSNLGLPGRILYHDGTSFASTSGRGLSTRLRDLARGEADLGFRALACFKGRLWTSPAGTFTDVDTSLHPVLYVNDGPAAGEPWREAVDVSDPASHPLADPDNIGIFQVEALGGHLWLSTFNRASGFELWRGDGRDCLAPWEGDGRCRMTWQKIIDAGGGRPADQPGPALDNAGATLGVFGGDLYVGAGESGINRIGLAELMRVPGADSTPEGGPGTPHAWELLVGWPRRDYDQPATRLPGLENLDCVRVGDMADEAPESWGGRVLTALDDDADADDCLPGADSGPGLDVSASGPLSVGSISYFWRFQEHGGELFLGTLDVFSLIDPRLRAGFDLLRSADGVHWQLVSDDGLGNLFNYGLRSLVSVPDLGLVVGTANPFTGARDLAGAPAGGTEIHVGTTAPGPFVPPRPDAGKDRLIFDLDRDGVVTAGLRGSAVDPFGGPGVTGYAWYRGALSDDCEDLPGAHADALLSTEARTAPLELAARSGEPGSPAYRDRIRHSFTLQARTADGGKGCDELTVTASHDLPPTGELISEVPVKNGLVELTDSDGDGAESYGVTGLCLDPEDAVADCRVEAPEPDATVIAQAPVACDDLGRSDADACVSARVRVLAADRLDPDAAGPELVLRAEDAAGYVSRFRWRTQVAPAPIDSGEEIPGDGLIERLLGRLPER